MGVKVKEVRKGFENVYSYQSNIDPFKEINEAFKGITGGKDLSKLIEEGRVFNMKGYPIGTAGLDANIDLILPVSVGNACDAMKEEGIMILDESAGNRPRHVYFDIKKNALGEPETLDMYASDPISKADLPSYMNTIATTAKDSLEPPVKPGFFNRLWDGIQRIFGGIGTSEMINYRNELVDYELRVEDIKKIHEGCKAIETEVKNAPDLKKGLENLSMIEKAVSDEKLGYEFDSPEWSNDWIIRDTFQNGVMEIASQDADIMKLVIGMGADGSIKQLYDAYKENFWEEGKTAEDKREEVQKMLKDTVAAHAAKKGETEKIPVKTSEVLSKSNDAQKLPG